MTAVHAPAALRCSADNSQLSAERATARPEVDEFGRFVRRILRAYSRRVADRDIEGLRGLAALRREVDAEIALAVRELHAAGYSWSEIARVLGVSRQAARKRYHDSVVPVCDTVTIERNPAPFPERIHP